MKNSKKILITIDGPSGVGKTTIGKALSKKLNASFFSSGALYRALSKHVSNFGLLSIKDIEIIRTDPFICQINQIEYLEKDLYTKEINDKSSELAQMYEVRLIVSNVLKQFYNSSVKGLVVEGRDMGSVVFPDANLKIYLQANDDVRSERRLVQSNNQETIEEIKKRDNRDSTRTHSPLIVPEGALIINNDSLPIDQVVKKIIMNLKPQ